MSNPKCQRFGNSTLRRISRLSRQQISSLRRNMVLRSLHPVVAVSLSCLNNHKTCGRSYSSQDAEVERRFLLKTSVDEVDNAMMDGRGASSSSLCTDIILRLPVLVKRCVPRCLIATHHNSTPFTKTIQGKKCLMIARCDGRSERNIVHFQGKTRLRFMGSS